MSDHFVGDIGTVITVDTGNDLTAATTTDLKVRKPSGATTTWTGAVVNDNYISYTTVEDDFDEAGTYRLQSYVVSPSGTWFGDTATFTVLEAYAQ
jgi:hypothetical protein